MVKKRLFRIFACVLAFFGSLLLVVELVATSSPDYKAMVDGVFGVNSSISASAEDSVYKSAYNDTTEMYTARSEIAKQLSAEGVTLLKNNNSLPISETAKVTLLGTSVYTYDGSGNLRDNAGGNHMMLYSGINGSHQVPQEVTLSTGKVKLPITLETALGTDGVQVNPEGVKVYSKKNFINGAPGDPGDAIDSKGDITPAWSVNEPYVSASDFNAGGYGDAAIVVFCRTSGEGRQYNPGENKVYDKNDGSKSNLDLSNNERNLISVASEISNNVIVLIASDVPMEIQELQNDERVDSVLWIGLVGSWGMKGVADVLTGQTAPSGKLPDIYASDNSSTPAAINFGDEAQDLSGMFEWSKETADIYTNAYNAHYVVLAEGIYTGYRYFETRYADAVNGDIGALSKVGQGRNAKSDTWRYDEEVIYPFGYGLSYTTFTQEIVASENGNMFTYNPEDQTVSVSVRVTNTGDMTGKDVVQLYVSLPYTDYDRNRGLEKSAIQLLAFEKTEPIASKDSVIVELKGELKYMTSYDETASHNGVTGGFVLEAGDYYFSIGNGSHEALNNALACKGVDASRLITMFDVKADAKKAIVWDPSKDSAFTGQKGGSFNSDGINVELFSTGEDGTIIENQLQDCDYNYFNPNTITYLTRSDWAGTYPEPYINLARVDSMNKYLNLAPDKSDSERLYTFSSSASNVTFGVDHTVEEDENGNAYKNMTIAEMKGCAFDDENWDYLLEQITFDEAWDFAPYGGANCNAFISVGAPEVWQIDGPGGNVNHPLGSKAPTDGYLGVSKKDPNYGFLSCDMPTQVVVGATFNKSLVFEQGEIFGEDGMWGRTPLQWAPGMNLHRTGFNARNHEYYSEDPILTGMLGSACVEGGLAKGQILAPKHFALNTQEAYRAGISQFATEQTLREMELRGFQYAIEESEYVNFKGNTVKCLGLMSSFSRLGAANVNAHRGLMVNILRKEWGFRGIISTDMVTGNGGMYFLPEDCVYNNVALMATSSAGSLLSNFWKEYNNKSKVESDGKLMAALKENMHHYMYTLANCNALNGYSANTVVQESSASFWEYLLYVFGILLLVGSFVFTALVIVFTHRKKSLAAIGDDRSVTVESAEAETETDSVGEQLNAAAGTVDKKRVSKRNKGDKR